MNKTDMQPTYHTIYQITNLVNSKIYIGKHQTDNLDDGYMGSGKLIRAAIDKYGIENFRKETLHVFDSEEDMNAKEKEIVTEEFVLQETNYNLCVGGHGGWSYVNREVMVGQKRLNINRQNIKQAQTPAARTKAILKIQKICASDEYRCKMSHAVKSSNEYRTAIEKRGPTFLGKTHTEETKQKMSERKQGKGAGMSNSQHGTCWITNGLTNQKIQKTEDIPEGWRLGRVIKKQ